MRQRVMSGSERSVVWNERYVEGPVSFFRNLLVFSDKSATTLKRSALVTNPVHVLLINCLAKYRRGPKQNGHVVVDFLPAMVGSDYAVA